MLISKFNKNNNNNNINKDILTMERKYKILLPKEYKDFLYKYNGGYTPNTIFKNHKIISDIQGFYGIGNVALSLNNLELIKWINKKIFPIAYDAFGNHIIIALNNSVKGKVYFADHELGDKIFCVANSLKAFLKKCKSDKISDDVKMSIEEREKILITNGRGGIINDNLRKMWQEEIDKYANMIQEEVIL